MKKFFILVVCLSILSIGAPALASDTYYQIKKDIKVLAFIGDPNSRKCKPVRYTTAIDQKIKLLHKKSGPGVYAFYLEGLLVKGEDSMMSIINDQGYFLARTKYITLIKGE